MHASGLPNGTAGLQPVAGNACLLPAFRVWALVARGRSLLEQGSLRGGLLRGQQGAAGAHLGRERRLLLDHGFEKIQIFI